MVLQTIRRQITVEEYNRIGEAGIFHDNERLELIDGEIVKTTPIGSRHAHCVNRMTEFLVTHAKAGIHEVWIVDLVSECVEIYQEPTSAGYKQMNTKKTSDTFSPSSFPDITVTVNWVLGKV